MKVEEKQALIDDCKEEIESIRWRIDRTVATMGSTAYLESCLKRQQIALASLTAQPVKLPAPYGMQDHERWLKQSEVESAIRAAGHEVQE